MMTLGSYEIAEIIAAEKKKILYRAYDPAVNQNVLIKVFQDESRHAFDSFLLKNEFDVLQSTRLEGCVEALRIETIDGYPAIIMRDPGGVILQDYIASHPLDYISKLRIAVRIASVLSVLHGRDILHKNISPKNIFLVPGTDEIILSEFGLAERMISRRETSFIGFGAPEYISPEQTGRTSRSVDYRSDIYSLGVLFYELFCGRRPYLTHDINGLFYAHMTVVPPSPHTLNADIPTALSDIIMKMIEKEPDDRYKSCSGLLADLEWVIRLAGGEVNADSFQLGQSDVMQRFSVPVKSYGKTQLIDQVEAIKYKVLSGGSRVALLEGVKGSGKSYVLDELYRRWIDQTGTVIMVDLTSQETTIPYHAIKLAVERFIELLHNSPVEKLSRFTEELSMAMGSNLSLLTAVIPSLSKLPIPGQEEAPDKDFEHKPQIERLVLLLAELIIAFDPPLVLMIDGLARMDDESVRILRNLLMHRHARAYFVIGTVEPDARISQELKKDAAGEETPYSLEVLSVNEYSVDDVQGLLRDTFGLASKRASYLSQLIMNKTSGNPYYTLEFVRRCCEENLLYFNSEFGGWDYKAAEIEKFQTTVNVANRALERLEELEAFEAEVLMAAAALGQEFHLEHLARIVKTDELVLNQIVAKALDVGLISGRYSFSDPDGANRRELPVFRFTHEAVFKQLLGRIDEPTRMRISHAYGELLREEGITTAEEMGLLLSHMNYSASLLSEEADKRELARLNLEYAIRLKWIGVLEKALKHTVIGLTLLDNVTFEETDQLIFRLHLERAELAYLNQYFEEAELYFNELIGNCTAPMNQAKAIRIKMVLYINQGKMKETIVLAEMALKALGVSFDAAPNAVSVGRELLKYNFGILNKEISDLDKLPVSTDTQIYMVTQIYMTLISVSYLVGKNLFIYVILKMLNMTLKHGLSVHSSYAFSIYGLIAGSALGNPPKGLLYGDLGIRLAERFGNQDMLAKCHFTYGFFLNHWVNHPSTNLPHLTTAIQLSYQTGDMVFYSYSVAAYILSLLDAGTPLNSVLSTVDRFFETVQEKHVHDIFNLLVLLRQVAFALRGETDVPYSLNAVDFDEAVFQDVLKASSMQSINAVYMVQKLKLAYLFGQHEMAYELCKQLQSYTQELMGLSVYPEYYQYYSLTCLEITMSDAARRLIIARNQRKLAKWMRYGPQNFQHRFLAVKAMCCVRRGQTVRGVALLTEALQSAQKNGFIQEEALINELLGRCYESPNQVMIRRMYLKTAFSLYKQWGAAAKESHMKRAYRDISFDETESPSGELVQNALNTGGDTASKQVDMLSVFKSAQTLSSEIQPKELLKHLLEIISENAGAQKTIVLMRRDTLVPVACGSEEGVTVFDESEAQICEYPDTIINQVARNLEPVILDDVTKIAILRKDPYVMRHSPVSIMCIPILWKNSLSGILYLENNHMSGAFNRGRQEVMQALTAQFVISYDNALLYESLKASEEELKVHKYKLERIVDERTAELSKANFEIQMLLDHAGQGFFSFDSSGRIGNELSRECYRLFQKNISGLRVSELLGSYSSSEETHLIDRIIDKAFKTVETFDAKVYLSLLPQELSMGEKKVTVEYQMIEDADRRRVMTILTDVTETHALMLIREEEKQNLKMIVRVIKNRNSFLRSLEDYWAFTHNGCEKLLQQEKDPQEFMAELFRMIHTFKGDFAQWGLRKTEAALHEIESLISYQREFLESREDVVDFIHEIDFEKAIGKDLNVLENAIGKSFLQGDEYYEISRTEIMVLEEMLDRVPTDVVKNRIKELRLVNMKELLRPYDDYIATLAFELDKKMNPLRITGEDLRVDRKHYHHLIKVLTHVFRNMMDYGIEGPEERLRLSKPEYGTISCGIERTGAAKFILMLEDDGSGIEAERILDTLLMKDPGRQDYYLGLSHEALIQQIFSDGVSTTGDITMLSGRGIGLAAVREEVERLGGTIEVRSIPGSGTRFNIELPVTM